MRRSALGQKAALVFAAATFVSFGLSSGASAAPVPLDPGGCSFNVSSTGTSSSTINGTSYGIRVKLVENGCRSTIRAYVHCNGFPLGTYYIYGKSISSTGSSSAAQCSPGDPRYGKSGYEIKTSSGWSKVPTLTN